MFTQKIWCYKWLPKLSGIRNCWLPPMWSNSSCGAVREDIGRGSLATTCRSANVARATYQGKAYAPKPLAEHILTVLDTSSAADICIWSKLLTRLVHQMFPKLCWTPIVTKVYESMSVAALPTIRMDGFYHPSWSMLDMEWAVIFIIVLEQECALSILFHEIDICLVLSSVFSVLIVSYNLLSRLTWKKNTWLSATSVYWREIKRRQSGFVFSIYNFLPLQFYPRMTFWMTWWFFFCWYLCPYTWKPFLPCFGKPS